MFVYARVFAYDTLYDYLQNLVGDLAISVIDIFQLFSLLLNCDIISCLDSKAGQTVDLSHFGQWRFTHPTIQAVEVAATLLVLTTELSHI